MKFVDLNRDGGIGANSMFVQLGDFNLLVDCGLHPKKTGRLAAPDLSRIRDRRVDLIVITHCHLDHIGALPIAMREHPEAPVVMTASSRMLLERMLHNSATVMMRQRTEDHVRDYPLYTHEEVERCAKRFTGLLFGQPKRFHGTGDEVEIKLHSAGHVAGAAGLEIRHKHRAIFFTGDVLFEDQRTVPGAKFPKGHFDTLVTETTRGDTDRPPEKHRAAEMARLVASINDTIRGGGSFLIPVFALGRMQEVFSILHDARRFNRLADCPIFASGLGLDLVDYFDEIARKTHHVQFNRGIVKDLRVHPVPRQLKAGAAPGKSGLYVVSSGMMVENTPSYLLASGMIGQAKNTVGFVGYCDPETPGGRLLGTRPGETFLFEKAHVAAKLKARIERFELSGHADREELLRFARQTQARSIVLTHGDPAARAWIGARLAEQMPESRVLDPVPLREYTA